MVKSFGTWLAATGKRGAPIPRWRRALRVERGQGVLIALTGTRAGSFGTHVTELPQSRAGQRRRSFDTSSRIGRTKSVAWKYPLQHTRHRGKQFGTG